MCANEDLPFRPDWVSPPCDTLNEVLEEHHIGKAQFASTMDMSEEEVDRLLTSDIEIDEDIAYKLESIFGVPSGFWLRREEHYRQELVRLGLVHGERNE